MKFKRFVSKSLIIGILLNSCLTSLASTVSEDGRYETFEGNSIAINDILEEDTVDVEIEGSTLVNLAYGSFETGGSSMLEKELTESAMSVTTISQGSLVGTKRAVLKDNTVYTVICDLNTNLNNVRYSFKNNDTYTQGMTSIDTKDYTQGYTRVVKTITTTSECTHVVVGSHSNEESGKYLNIKNLILFEGDWTNKKIPDYFEGVKSSFEEKINDEGKYEAEILSNNGNLLDKKKYTSKTHSTGIINSEEDGVVDFNCGVGNGAYRIDINMNDFDITKDLYFMIDVSSCTNFNRYGIYCREKDFASKIFGSALIDKTGIIKFRVPANTITNDYMFLVYAPTINSTDENIVFKNITISYIDYAKPIQYESNKKEILLNEPLRGLPDVVKDKIIKKDGQWVIERNYTKLVLDGYNVESMDMNGNGNRRETHIMFRIKPKLTAKPENGARLPKFIVSDKFPTITPEQVWGWETLFNNANYKDREGISVGTGLGHGIDIRILKSKLNEVSVNAFKEWLKVNPVTIIYQLAEPIYEPLNIDSTLDLYLDATCITNNSTIPANMKVTVDRTVNRAQEAIELAKTNPTVENLSQARYWINLMKDSLNKDNLQNQINDITQISDLDIELKKVSSSLDVYVKSKNSLTMTLSTNSIIFDGFTGVDDMEKLNAINITVNSSLPYQLNSYMMTELANKDNTKVIPKELFNIRLNGESDYKAFANINEKLVLKKDCEKGNNNQFNIDLILKGSLTHKADIYKTVIKLEAEQK